MQQKLEDLLTRILGWEHLGWAAVVAVGTLVVLGVLRAVMRALAENAGTTPAYDRGVWKAVFPVLPLCCGVGLGALLRAAEVWPPLLWILFGPLSAAVGAVAWKVWHDHPEFAAALKRKFGLQP